MFDIPRNTLVAARINAKKVVSGSQKYALVITHSKSMVQVADEKCEFAAVSSASTNYPKIFCLSLLLLILILIQQQQQHHIFISSHVLINNLLLFTILLMILPVLLLTL
jgi:hypothetical protein